jgi:serine/threonine-protein kinase
VATPRALVAEDDEVNRRMLVRALGTWGYEPVEATDGTEALRVVRGDAPPPLAIVDGMMPGADGLEVCRVLRTRPGGAAFLVSMLDAKTSGEDAPRAFDPGADDYLRKPYALDELRARLSVIARGEARDDVTTAQAASPTSLDEGSVVAGRWILEVLLGRGGVSTALRARHATLGIHAALEVLRSELVQNEIARDRFESEAMAAARLGSRHMARALDHGFVRAGPGYGVEVGGSGDAPFIAVELLSGHTPATALADRGPLPPCEARVPWWQVAQGLARAHEAGLVHRDFKTENDSLAGFTEDSPNGLPHEAEVLDCGIAKDLRATRSLTESGMAVGALEAMAPEQPLSEENLTPAVDVRVYGVLAFETLTGVSRFAAGSVGATTLAICEGRVPALSQVHEELLSEFHAWFATARARDPLQHFLTFREAANALDTASSHPIAGRSALP